MQCKIKTQKNTNESNSSDETVHYKSNKKAIIFCCFRIQMYNYATISCLINVVFYIDRYISESGACLQSGCLQLRHISRYQSYTGILKGWHCCLVALWFVWKFKLEISCSFRVSNSCAVCLKTDPALVIFWDYRLCLTFDVDCIFLLISCEVKCPSFFCLREHCFIPAISSENY